MVRIVLFGLLGLLMAREARASSDGSVAATVDTIANRYLTTTSLIGLGIIVVRNGVVAHEAGYGKAQLAPPIPADGTTRFDYFSVGKHVTTALILRLEERGLLDLDSLVGKYVPELDPFLATSTLRQLLSHTSGNAHPEIDERNVPAEYLVAPTDQTLLAWLAKGKRVEPPGSTWIYYSDGFITAALVAERVAGFSYGELVEREFAKPLGLRHFGFELSPRAVAYMVDEGKRRPVPPIPYAWFTGAGSICGTLGDLARWWMSLRAGRVLSDASLATMTSPITLRRNGASAEFGYGLGVRLGSYGGHRMIGHTGDGAGGTAVLVEYPDDSLLIAVATNTAGEGIPHAVAIEAEIARALLSLEYGKPVDRAVPPELIERAPGHYVSPYGSFCVSARDGSLFESDDGEEPFRLLHQGDGVFRRAESTGAELYFLGEPRKQWFAYRFHGYTMDLAVRATDTCP